MTADLLYSETERDLATALADLLADRAAPADVIARTERPETYDTKLWRTVAAEIGIAGLLIPQALGGAGASYRELAAAAEQFGAFAAPIPYLGSAAVATAVLLSAARSAAAGDARPGAPSSDGLAADDPGGLGSASSGPAAAIRAAQLRAAAAGASSGTRAAPVSPAAALLRQLADGSRTAALAVTAATRSAAPFPSLVRVAGRGDAGSGTVRLRGTIPAVADALTADVLLVPADGVPSALYLVEAAAHGVHRTPLVSLDMTRQLCDITLDDAPGRQVVVGAAAGAAVSDGLAAGAAILAAEQLGLAQRCLDLTVANVKERRQFARPHRLARGVQKVRHLHARDRRGILKGEEEAGASPLVGGQSENILAVEGGAPRGHLIFRMTGEREGQRRFAAAVGAHERVNLAAFDHEIDAFEDLVSVDAAMKIFDAKTGSGHAGLLEFGMVPT